MDTTKTTRTNGKSHLLSIRYPLDTMERMRRLSGYTGQTLTDIVLAAVDEYLKNHGPLDLAAEKGERD